ncbi:MAG: hypothetical protein AAFY36_13130 [Bacteroidota bacterium]
MTKFVYFFSLYFALSFGMLSAQSSSQEAGVKSNVFDITASAKLGSAILNTSDYIDLSGNVVSSEVLIGYTIRNRFKISTGAALTNFNANVFVGGQQFGLQSQFLQIPLKVNIGYDLVKLSGPQQIDLVFGVGAIGSYQLNEELRGADTETDNDTQGWHVGLVVELGVNLSIKEDLALGIFLENNFPNTELAEGDEVSLDNRLVKFSFNYQF